jgi:hypothetical protein
VVITSLYLIKEFPRIELVYLADLEAIAGRMSDADSAEVEAIATATGTRRIVALAFALLGRRGVTARAPILPDLAASRLAIRVEAALADPQHRHKRRYWHRLSTLLTHAGFRERLSDRLRVAAALPAFVLRPDMDDVLRAAAEGRPPWAMRLGRLPAVAAGLIAARPAAEDLVAAKLADRRARIVPTPGVELFLLDDAGLLLASGTGELLALSTTATFIWCALEEGMTVGELVAAYARAFARSEQAAMAEIHAAARRWAQAGLLEGGAAPAPAPAEPPLLAVPVPPPATPLPVARSYEILGTRFLVGFATAAEALAVDEVLGHFRPRGPTRTCRAACVPEGAGTALWIDGTRHDVARTAEGLVPMVKHALIAEAVNRQGFELCIPGSGKTCLSLALAAAGLGWHTDETVLLEGEALLARGVPACPCVKEPAWPLVEPLVHGLEAARVHRRVDGKIVRYPPPPVDLHEPALSRAWPVRWIVFPRYVPTGAAGLTPLSRVEGLRRLLAETPAMRARLDARLVGRLVDWLGGIRCYALELDGFEPAVTALRGLVAARDPAARRRGRHPGLAQDRPQVVAS